MAKTKKTSAGPRRAQSSRGKKRSQPGKSVGKKTTKKKTVRKTATKTKAARPKKKAGAKAKAVRKSPLDRKHLNEFREILLQRRRTLLGDLNGMEENASNQNGGGNLSSMPTHMADIGTDNFEHEFTLGLLESEQALLGEINGALRRIEDGTYGICLGTGRRIPLARLHAKPWAKYTVKYARMLEQGLISPPEEADTVPEDK